MDYQNMKRVLSENIRKYIYVPVTQYEPGNIVFHKGDDGDAMFEVVDGEVGIYIHYGEKTQQLLAVKRAGEYFGEIALLENRPRTATVVALTETSLRKIHSAAGFLYYICLNPEKLEEVLGGMSERFKAERNNYLRACETLAEYKAAVESGASVPAELAERVNRCTKEAGKVQKKLPAEQPAAEKPVPAEETPAPAPEPAKKKKKKWF